jgi:hypothetical protein
MAMWGDELPVDLKDRIRAIVAKACRRREIKSHIQRLKQVAAAELRKVA